MKTDGDTVETVTEFIFLGSKITADGDGSHEVKRCLLLGRKAVTHLDSILKSKVSKATDSQSYGFSSSHVWTWDLDQKEGWVPKNWCFWIVVLEKILESSLDCKEIKPINPKGSQTWIFIRRTDAEAETPILWPSDAKSWLTEKTFDAGKNWRQKKKKAAEDEMVGWHHRLNGHEFERALGDGEGQGGLAGCSPWGRKESDSTERLTNIK